MIAKMSDQIIRKDKLNEIIDQSEKSKNFLTDILFDDGMKESR